MLDFITTILRL